MDVVSLLSPEAVGSLERLVLDDRERALRMLRRLGERAGSPPDAVPLVETVLSALPDAADPEMALLNLERWTGQLATPSTTFALLREDPALLDDLLHLFGASQYLSDILIRDPWLFSLLLEQDSPLDGEHYHAAVQSAIRPLQKSESRRDALRRVKRREFLRIGWRDLSRRAPLPEVVREISDLADALVAAALQLAREEVDSRFPTASAAVRFTVIAMGKLGARELNYSSDIDLVFVMDSPTPGDEGHRRYATRLAETLIAVLAQDTGEGRVFRVDMRLRPEGRSGALVRTYAGFRDYYDRWAETWERQALIKARPVAGDEELGERFMALTRPVIYRRLQGASLLEDVREMRLAVERKLDAAGEMDGHVKEGRGTIRDVEFTVQLLQLLFGTEHPDLQVSDTWTALQRLAEAGLLSGEERETFAEGYRFFREVEHRLQILHDLPVRRLPADSRDLRRLARTMAFPGAEEFLEAYRTRSEQVRALAGAIYERLGFRLAEGEDELRSAVLTADTSEGAAVLREELERRQFPEAEAAVRDLVRLASGGPHFPHPSSTRRLFADIAPAVLDGCAAAADPAEAVQALADFADRKLLHRALYQTWREHSSALQALCRFGGGAPAAMRVVLRHPELSDLVTDEEQLSVRRDIAGLREDLARRLKQSPSYERRLSALRRFKLREFVRLAARHVLEADEPGLAEAETAEWADVAEVLVEASLEVAQRRLREEGRWPRDDAADFAVFALGRFGGRDLHFASDLDLVYVFGAEAGLTQQQYELLAKAFGDVLQGMTEEGRLFSVDLRLRPEGRQGFTVASLDAARRYYGEGGRGQTWEFQMLTRLRPVAGSETAAREFRAIVEPRVYRSPMPEEWTREIRAMKKRIELERVSAAEREWHLKLGPGGLSDIEFLVQYLQLRHGGEDPCLRETATVPAIHALAARSLFTLREAQALLSAHQFLTRLRQSLSLLQPDGGPDALPVAPGQERRGRAVSRAMGCGDIAVLQEQYRAQTVPVREAFLWCLGKDA
jgi:[glutamine synthetase] adenylyltransferase / [glutamine synthetase]-adenylyl-L-tyrosine phosphorylase